MTTKIGDLSKRKRDELISVWLECFDESPPPRLRKELLVPLLIYRLQERQHGGLSQSARRRLKGLAEQYDGKGRSCAANGLHHRAGTRLVRSWKGELHEVTVTEQGFEYRGQRFPNLSVIAREITGTRWSGPVFFGLREKAS